MRWLVSFGFAILLGMGPVGAPQAQAEEAVLQGNWTATKAERDGKPADDVVGHRLSFTGDRFEIRSDKGEALFAGTVRSNASVKPASIDFALDNGAAKGTAWKGIYLLDGDTLTICDNAPDTTKDRPTALEAKAGSGYVLVVFQRSKP